MRNLQIVKKAEGRDSANKKVYANLEKIFAWTLNKAKSKNQSIANGCIFIIAEIIDNIFLKEKDYFSTIKIEIIHESEENNQTTVEISYDGKGYNPFAEESKTTKIKKNIKRLNCVTAYDLVTRGAAGENILITFSFAFIPTKEVAPYSFSSDIQKDFVTAKFCGRIIRGWGLETDDDLLKLATLLKKEASSKVIIFDLKDVDFWDTMGSDQILQIITDINGKNEKRARVHADKELIDYIPHYQSEIDNGKVPWYDLSEDPLT